MIVTVDYLQGEAGRVNTVITVKAKEDYHTDAVFPLGGYSDGNGVPAGERKSIENDHSTLTDAQAWALQQIRFLRSRLDTWRQDQWPGKETHVL